MRWIIAGVFVAASLWDMIYQRHVSMQESCEWRGGFWLPHRQLCFDDRFFLNRKTDQFEVRPEWR